MGVEKVPGEKALGDPQPFQLWRVGMGESEAVLQAQAVIVVIAQAQIIGINESAFGQGIFRFNQAFRVFPVFLDGIAGLNFSLALQFNGEGNIVESETPSGSRIS